MHLILVWDRGDMDGVSRVCVGGGGGAGGGGEVVRVVYENHWI